MLKVSDLMTKELFTLRRNDSLKAARSIMDLKRIRHIPIVSGDEIFEGLLTHRDLLSATISKLADIDSSTQGEIDAGIPVGEIMNSDVRTTTPSTPLKECAYLLLNHKYGCLPVIEDGSKLVGIITEADFLKLTISLMEALEQSE